MTIKKRSNRAMENEMLLFHLKWIHMHLWVMYCRYMCILDKVDLGRAHWVDLFKRPSCYCGQAWIQSSRLVKKKSSLFLLFPPTQEVLQSFPSNNNMFVGVCCAFPLPRHCAATCCMEPRLHVHCSLCNLPLCWKQHHGVPKRWGHSVICDFL